MNFRNVKIAWLVPTIVAFLGLSPRAAAIWDLGLSGAYRSFPLSGIMEVQSGYGLLLYGAPGEPFSGYVRPAVEVASAGTYNSGAAKLEIFPLAILGARAGGEAAQNDRDYAAFDCVAWRCRGRFHKAYVEGELSLGAGPFFLQGRWRRERWSQPDAGAGDFVEPTSGLVMTSAGESQTVYHGLTGVRLGEPWMLAVGLRYAEGEIGLSRMLFAVARYKSGQVSVGLGGGFFESELKNRGGLAMAFLNWELLPGVALR